MRLILGRYVSSPSWEPLSILTPSKYGVYESNCNRVPLHYAYFEAYFDAVFLHDDYPSYQRNEVVSCKKF